MFVVDYLFRRIKHLLANEAVLHQKLSVHRIAKLNAQPLFSKYIVGVFFSEREICQWGDTLNTHPHDPSEVSC